jgi:hypothetical protein
MKIIDWNNLELQGFRYSEKTNKWYRNNNPYIKIESCEVCKEPFMTRTSSVSRFCSYECSNIGRIGEGNPMYGKHHSKKTRKIIGECSIGEKNGNWKGGYRSKGLPEYNKYAPQLEWCEEVRRNKQDQNMLEVKCFKCGKWYIPTLGNLNSRIQILKNNDNYQGQSRFYCSNECKNTCSIFGKKIESLMKQDVVISGRISWMELTREVQPELRQIVLKRDKYKCVKCNSIKNLQCHHILPVSIEPLLSADTDNCIILCKDCHKEVHKQDGCKYNQLRMEIC